MNNLKNLKEFLKEVNKLSPFIEKTNLNLKLNELLLISQISNLEKINTKTLFQKNSNKFSRAQFYRYLDNLVKSHIIDVKKGIIRIKI
tara:strand:- start:878 stop:1141 length:264 start_codon:yes stop_codon:yes gene_type:complete